MSGGSFADALYMAQDAIGILGLCILDDKKDLPKASELEDVESDPGDIVTSVEVDFEAYRESLAHEKKRMKKRNKRKK